MRPHSNASAGMTDQAIQLLEENLEQAAKMPPAERSRMRNLLGICYLRYGEQQNCISNHVASPASCPLTARPCTRFVKLPKRIRPIPGDPAGRTG